MVESVGPDVTDFAPGDHGKLKSFCRAGRSSRG